MLRTTGTLLMVLALVACGGEEQAAMPEDMGLPDADVETILSMDRSFQVALLEGDVQALRGLYAEDAVHMPPDHPAVEGVDSILAHWAESLPEGGIPGFNTDTDVIHGDATIGYHRAAWTSDDETAPSGKLLWVLRRMPDGQWKIVADMYNFDS